MAARKTVLLFKLSSCTRTEQSSRGPTTIKRAFTATSRAMIDRNDLSISAGHDTETVTKDAIALVDHGQWVLCNSGKGLERQFKFKTFKATWVRASATYG